MVDARTHRGGKDRDVRSILLYGRKALGITLPAGWLRAHNLSAGDKVSVSYSIDGSLIIRPVIKNYSLIEKKRINIDARGRPFPLLVREIIAAYSAGFDEIRVENGEREILRRLKNILETVVLGLIVLDESEKSITFYTVVDPRSIGFWDALQQEYKVARKMLRLALEGLRTGDRSAFDTVVETDTVVDKLYLYIARVITSTLMGLKPVDELKIPSPAELPTVFLAAKSIERIADHAVIISVNGLELVRSGLTVSDEVTSMLYDGLNYFTRVGRALVNGFKGQDDFERLFEAPEEKVKLTVDSVPEARILDSSRRIIRYSLDIAESVVQLSMIRQAYSTLQSNTM